LTNLFVNSQPQEICVDRGTKGLWSNGFPATQMSEPTGTTGNNAFPNASHPFVNGVTAACAAAGGQIDGLN
jgi:hypothetical protein